LGGRRLYSPKDRNVFLLERPSPGEVSSVYGAKGRTRIHSKTALVIGTGPAGKLYSSYRKKAGRKKKYRCEKRREYPDRSPQYRDHKGGFLLQSVPREKKLGGNACTREATRGKGRERAFSKTTDHSLPGPRPQSENSEKCCLGKCTSVYRRGGRAWDFKK